MAALPWQDEGRRRSCVCVQNIVSQQGRILKLVAARNGVKRLKMVKPESICCMDQSMAWTHPIKAIWMQLRHPNILAFKDTAEVEEKGETVIYLVTEPCKPLADALEELDMTGSARQASSYSIRTTTVMPIAMHASNAASGSVELM